ncbi:hypothetical protein HOY82DRAFT_540966 [Tuber indicum]|nr:hypothetical protein HOY82DRAFT_540966 [Tuber indicum]
MNVVDEEGQPLVRVLIRLGVGWRLVRLAPSVALLAYYSFKYRYHNISGAQLRPCAMSLIKKPLSLMHTSTSTRVLGYGPRIMKQKGTRKQNLEGARHRKITRDERLKVITLRDNAGWTWTQIGQHLNIYPRTCQRIYKRAKENGTPSNTRRSGRPPIFNDMEQEQLEAFVTRDART